MSAIVVIGGGIAGLAAACAARAAAPGRDVRLVLGRPGATQLSPGVVDHRPWDVVLAGRRAAGIDTSALAAPPLDPGALTFLEELGLHAAPHADRSLVATTGGVVRSADLPTRTQLDLARLGGRTVLLPTADRAAWDARSLVRSLSAEDHGISFEVSDAVVLRFSDESTIADVDLANRHDAEDRVRWLASQLERAKRVRGGEVAFLLGPWLGLETDARAALERAVGCPIGEIVSPHARTFGVRFEHARARLCASHGIRVVDGDVERVARIEDGAFDVHVGSEVIRAGRLVLAVGGLVGGGIAYRPPLHGAEADGATRMAPSFVLGLEGFGNAIAPRHDRTLAGSTEGPVLDQTAWPRGTFAGTLERTGITADADGSLPRAPNVIAAGDAVANRDRTMLRAIESGLVAGATAARRAD